MYNSYSLDVYGQIFTIHEYDEIDCECIVSKVSEIPRSVLEEAKKGYMANFTSYMKNSKSILLKCKHLQCELDCPNRSDKCDIEWSVTNGKTLPSCWMSSYGCYEPVHALSVGHLVFIVDESR